MVLIGAHAHGDDPVAVAAELDAQCVQLFLADPQGWKKPVPSRRRGRADRLRAGDLRARAVPGQRRVDQQPDPDPEPEHDRAARRGRGGPGRAGADRARRARRRRRRHRRRHRQLAQDVRARDVPGARPGGEHRRRGERLRADPRPDRAALGRDRPVRRRAAASTRATRGRRARTSRRSSTGCAPSRGASTWCTPTARATRPARSRDRHANFATGTIPPELDRARGPGGRAATRSSRRRPRVRREDIAFLQAALAG